MTKIFIPIGIQTAGVVFEQDTVKWYMQGVSTPSVLNLDNVEFCSYINDHSSKSVEPGHWNSVCKSGKTHYLISPADSCSKAIVAVRTATFEKDFDAFVHRCAKRIKKLKEALTSLEKYDSVKLSSRPETDQARIRDLKKSVETFLEEAPFHHRALVHAVTLKLLLR